MKVSKNLIRAKIRRTAPVHRLTVILRERGLFTKPEGVNGVLRFGHRASVGGEWHKTGKRQLDFMISRGLKPSNVFVDVGCGSLRAGCHFIPYLEPKNYLGLEKVPALLRAGIKYELDEKLLAEKLSQFVISDKFEFQKFQYRPTYGLAASVFSHLNADDIALCLRNLKQIAAPGCKFYATYFEIDKLRRNYKKSHAHYSFYFTRSEMGAMGEENGWQVNHLGDWKHSGAVPQKVMEFAAK